MESVVMTKEEPDLLDGEIIDDTDSQLIQVNK